MGSKAVASLKRRRMKVEIDGQLRGKENVIFIFLLSSLFLSYINVIPYNVGISWLSKTCGKY